MDSQNTSKLNHLLRTWPRGTLGLQDWLDTMGIYRQLADRYCQGGWLKRVGAGAYQLMDDQVNWMGAVYALQQQLHYRLHVGGLTALELQGYSHFLRFDHNKLVWLLKNSEETRLLPRWFLMNFSRENEVLYLNRDFLKKARILGLHDYSVKDFQITVSSPERAILECMELTPSILPVEHAKSLMENMSTLRPTLVQQLLEACSSIKAKRLFMLLADHCGHAWVSRLQLEKIDFGEGKRVLEKGGRYYPKYRLSLPIYLDEHEGYEEDEK